MRAAQGGPPDASPPIPHAPSQLIGGPEALDGKKQIGETLGVMTMAKIQEEVGQLPESERRRLTAWMVEHYPLRTVEGLVSRAEADVRQGKWVPTPPTADNIPTGEALSQALLRAKKLGIAR